MERFVKNPKGFKRWRNRSLFFKILLYFLSFLIPLVTIGIATYIYSVRLVYNDFNYRIEQNLRAAATTIDIYMQVAEETLVNFFQDSEIKRLLLPRRDHNLEISSELWKIPRALQRNENIVSSFAHNIFAYIDDSIVYVHGGVSDFDVFFEELNRYSLYDSKFWRGKLESHLYLEILPVAEIDTWEPFGAIRVIPIIMTSRIGINNAVVVLNISVDSVIATLKGNAVFPETRFLSFDLNNNQIYGESNLAISPHVLADLIRGEMDDNEVRVVIDNRSYYLNSYKARLHGWIYYALTPVHEINRKAVGILKMTLVLSIILIVMSTAFSFIFTIILYNPIRNIRDIILAREEITDYKPEIQRSGNEIDIIKQGLNRLVSENRIVKSRYDAYTREYIDYSFIFLLKGQVLNEESILRETLEAELGFQKNGFICACILLNFENTFFKNVQDTERLDIIREVKRIVWALLEETLNVYIIEYRHNLLVCIINTDSNSPALKVRMALQRVVETFKIDSPYCSMTFGIGNYFNGIANLFRSYNNAMTALSMRSEDSQFEIIDSSTLKIENMFYYSFIYEQKILNSLKLGRIHELGSVLDVIFKENIDRGISWKHLQMLCDEIYTTGVRYAAERGIAWDLEGPAKNSVLHSDNQDVTLVSVRSIKEEILKFLKDLIDENGDGNGSHSKTTNLTVMIIKYIEENYTQGLCLEKIADALGVSAKYVSRVFHDRTGKHLTAFINELRIGKAKELMASTNMSIGRIASSIGIDSRTTFLRVFRKVEGMSPSEYRNHHRQRLKTTLISHGIFEPDRTSRKA